MLNACIRFIYDIPLTNHDLINYFADSHILLIEYYTYAPLRENFRLGDDCFIIVTEQHIEKQFRTRSV